MLAAPVSFDAEIERRPRDLARVVVLPLEAVDPAWDATFVAHCALDGGAPERRPVELRGDGRWFVELAAPQRARATVDAGDRVRVTLTAASAVPSVLLAALDASGLRGAWEALTPAQRRELAEPVFAARGAQTREMQVAAALARLNARGAA